MTKQYTFSLPPEAGAIVDQEPRMEKSKLVAKALLQYKQDTARRKALDILASITPKKWATDKDSVELVREARLKRSQDIMDN